MIRPRCKEQPARLRIAVTFDGSVCIYDRGDGGLEAAGSEPGDLEWADDSCAQCRDCGREGTVKDLEE